MSAIDRTDREAARGLIPLYAGGDLDADEAARVGAAIAGDAELEEELATFEELDRSLRGALAPARESDDAAAKLIAEIESRAARATETAPPLVRRQCPYCHDDLDFVDRAFCASCMTPHHRECFAENRGCSLLGCGGTRSVTPTDPSFVVCAACSESTPSGAPFCAWCGAPLRGDVKPRHSVAVARPISPARERLRFAAACAALLIGCWFTGALLGVEEGVALQSMMQSNELIKSMIIHQPSEEAAQKILRDIADAQQACRDFVDKGAHFETAAPREGDYAPDLLSLVLSLHRNGRLHERQRRILRDDVLNFGRYGYAFEVVRSRTAPRERFYAVARPLGLVIGRPHDAISARSFFVNQTGEIEILGDRAIDPDLCEIKKGESKR